MVAVTATVPAEHATEHDIASLNLKVMFVLDGQPADGSEAAMAEQTRRQPDPKEKESEDMRSGKGRKDEVGGSGIYPASSPNAPGDAEIRSEGELGHHREPRVKPANEQTPKKGDLSSGSE